MSTNPEKNEGLIGLAAQYFGLNAHDTDPSSSENSGTDDETQESLDEDASSSPLLPSPMMDLLSEYRDPITLFCDAEEEVKADPQYKSAPASLIRHAIHAKVQAKITAIDAKFAELNSHESFFQDEENPEGWNSMMKTFDDAESTEQEFRVFSEKMDEEFNAKLERERQRRAMKQAIEKAEEEALQLVYKNNAETEDILPY